MAAEQLQTHLLSLMEASHCVEEREMTKATKRKNDIIKQLKPTLTPHYFRHNYATLLFEVGVEPLIAMKILGHTDYQTTAKIYTHLKSEMMKKSSVDMEEVFRRKQEAKSALAKSAGYARQTIPEAGAGYEPAVGGEILTNTLTAMTQDAPWPILFC